MIALTPVHTGFVGGNRVLLLEGGDQLFPAMQRALAGACRQVWLATYIFHDDAAGLAIAGALCAAAQRGVKVHVVVDGFGSKAAIPALRRMLESAGVVLDVFRPLDRWSAWLQPSQLRRLHHKLCVVDEAVAFVGGINILDDHFDLRHGRSERARLDYAVELAGPVVAQVRHLAQALTMRAHLGHEPGDGATFFEVAHHAEQGAGGHGDEVAREPQRLADVGAAAHADLEADLAGGVMA